MSKPWNQSFDQREAKLRAEQAGRDKLKAEKDLRMAVGIDIANPVPTMSMGKFDLDPPGDIWEDIGLTYSGRILSGYLHGVTAVAPQIQSIPVIQSHRFAWVDEPSLSPEERRDEKIHVAVLKRDRLISGIIEMFDIDRICAEERDRRIEQYQDDFRNEKEAAWTVYEEEIEND